MAPDTELTRLEKRRGLLLNRSELYRQQMAVELDSLRGPAAWVERGFSVVQMLRSVWPLVATAAGLLVARKGGSIFRNVGKIWTGYRLARRVLGFWTRKAEG